MSRSKRKPGRVAARAASREGRPTLFRAAIAIGSAMVILVLVHTPYVNGPWYWHWGWQRLSASRAYPGVLLASLPFLLAQVIHERLPTRRALGLGLLMLTTLALELNTIVMASGTFSTQRLWQIVEDVRATSYYTDAIQSYRLMPTLKSWFVAFPDILPRLHIHSQNKPPGLMLFYMFFVANFSVDNHQAAVLAGLVLGVLATLAIPATYFLVRALGGSQSAAFFGASAMTVCPGFILFFPEFDQIYASVGAVLVGCWILSLRRRSRGWALACGAALCLACFLAFNLLVLGLFMGAAAAYLVLARRECSVRQLAENSAIVLGCVVLCYATLQIVLSFDLVATFQSSLANQSALVANMVRPYPQTILFDLTDYALGLGWMSAAVLVMSARASGDPDAARDTAFVRIHIGQLLVLAVCALLAVETARVWIFLFPLAMIAVGQELERWSFHQRLAFFGVAFVSLAAIGQNMIFFSLTPAP